jgi:hypothetical protein
LADGKDLRIEYRRGERRNERRTEVDLSLTVWGVSTKGERFLQQVRARDISLSGAMISGLDTELRSGDVIGILYAGKKARYRVVWIRYDGEGEKLQAAVHRIVPDECPWESLLGESAQIAAASRNAQAAQSENPA